MRIKYCIVALLCCFSSLFAQRSDVAPKLYLNIVVDQLRTDFLYEFEELYCDGGFKRLLSGGKVYENVYYAFDNIDRATAVATLSTGTNPYVSGIVAERWLDRKSLRVVNCVEDKSCKGVYSNEAFSPASLKALTITDEIKRSTRGNSIVCSIAPDGDAAVLAGGELQETVEGADFSGVPNAGGQKIGTEIKLEQFSLELRSSVRLRVYFGITSEAEERGFTVKVSGKDVNAVKIKNGVWCIEQCVPASRLAEFYSFVITSGESSLTVNLSALYYAKIMHTQAKTEAERNLMKAIKLYYDAAVNYVASVQ